MEPIETRWRLQLNLASPTLDRNTFEAHLLLAAQHAISFAREFVRQELPSEFVFLIYPNQSYDGMPRTGDEEVFPDESLPEGQFLGPFSVQQAMSFLWRNERVPEWIDVSVRAENAHHSAIALRCCGRFTAEDELLYHRYPNSVPPLSIKSPPIPPGWESVEKSGKFDLYWEDKRAGRKRPQL
jgi:hypothetical protein